VFAFGKGSPAIEQWSHRQNTTSEVYMPDFQWLTQGLNLANGLLSTRSTFLSGPFDYSGILAGPTIFFAALDLPGDGWSWSNLGLGVMAKEEN
jgi:hypothetical protein